MRMSKMLPICETAENEIYWKKNLEYRMLENAHKRDMKKVKPKTFFMFPLNNTNKKHINADISKSIPIALLIYEVASKGTSTY